MGSKTEVPSSTSVCTHGTYPEGGNRGMICVTEPLDLSEAPRFLERARRLAQNCRLLIVDLQQADFIDSSGVRALLELAGVLEATGKELSVVIRPESRVERTLALLQLRERFQCYPSLSAASQRERAIA